ncbi:hypothetical protein [Amycolatopsis sp. cmx-8-4]|uniref:hypothetical protein n=1 Tax=Amycolatopsis sp. cmx-8-4 TaxID=2790947 RepID=UPI00397C8D46
MAEAESWALRGLKIDNSIGKDELRDVYVDLLLERGATDDALALRWTLFDRHPTRAHYHDLRRTTERTGGRPGLRDKAIGRLRDASTSRPGFADQLIAVFVDEGELDNAWETAVGHSGDLPESRWHQLIDLRQPAHPQDVIEPWQRLIQSRLTPVPTSTGTRKPSRWLRYLRDAYAATDNAAAFAAYLGRLRELHKRKTAFIAKLDRVDL